MTKKVALAVSLLLIIVLAFFVVQNRFRYDQLTVDGQELLIRTSIFSGNSQVFDEKTGEWGNSREEALAAVDTVPDDAVDEPVAELTAAELINICIDDELVCAKEYANKSIELTGYYYRNGVDNEDFYIDLKGDQGGYFSGDDDDQDMGRWIIRCEFPEAFDPSSSEYFEKDILTIRGEYRELSSDGINKIIHMDNCQVDF